LTAIVISFGMTALTLVMAVRGYFESGGDDVDLLGPEEEVAKERR
jgi:multicomponent K+:H+ antiporter subunit C